MSDAQLDTFPRLLLNHAAVRPNHPAIREKDLGIWQTWTWSQVAGEVRALACGLAAQGFGIGSRRDLFVERHAEALLRNPRGRQGEGEAELKRHVARLGHRLALDRGHRLFEQVHVGFEADGLDVP